MLAVSESRINESCIEFVHASIRQSKVIVSSTSLREMVRRSCCRLRKLKLDVRKSRSPVEGNAPGGSGSAQPGGSTNSRSGIEEDRRRNIYSSWPSICSYSTPASCCKRFFTQKHTNYVLAPRRARRICNTSLKSSFCFYLSHLFVQLVCSPSTTAFAFLLPFLSCPVYPNSGASKKP